MILALLACTHTPAALHPAVPDLADLGAIPPAHGPTPGVTAAGLNTLTPEDLTRLKTRSRLLTACIDDRQLVHRSWSQDVARGNAAHAKLDTAAHQSAKRLQAQHVALPLSLGLAFIKGTLVPIGYEWVDGRVNP